ncbi:hypothetical protein [Salinibacter altiplanensis]|uniref:hypothetical protein n=1 Tax=Salinibacter altiplanensis TaxID=1803181 RepID=UPI001F1CD475|nr:hypothetical protein [Salinibacter altiplanensis]
MRPQRVLPAVALFALLIAPAQAQHHEMHSAQGEAGPSDAAVLQAPGQAVFGTVQEAIRALEADSTTDWSEVDVDRLRRHLLDMHHVAMHVDVVQKTPIENGVRIRVRPTKDAARAALGRVLDAHPAMLKMETGWTMDVDKGESAYTLRVTTEAPREEDKIRALGYIGLLAYGQHHQHHHWKLVQGTRPHEPSSHHEDPSP